MSKQSAIVLDRDNWEREAWKLRAINDDLLAALERALAEHQQQELGYSSACWCIDAEVIIAKAKLPA